MKYIPVQIITEKPHLRDQTVELIIWAILPPGTMVTIRRIFSTLTNINRVTRTVSVIIKMPTVGRASIMMITKLYRISCIKIFFI